MVGYKSLMAPIVLPQRRREQGGSMIAASATGGVVYDLMYYLKSALAGGICCSITHGSLCPVDVVKTKIQLDPVKYNKGLIGGFSQVIKEEGIKGLATGLGPTVVGYFIQGFSSAPMIKYLCVSQLSYI